MNNLKRNSKPGGLATLLSILLGIGLLISIPGFSVSKTLLNQQFYMDILEKNQFFEQFPDILAISLIQSDISPIQFNPDQASSIIHAIVSQDWIRGEISNIIQKSVDYFNLQTNDFVIMVNLQPIKANLFSEAGQQAISSLVISLPDCSEEQLTQLFFNVQMGQPITADCSPLASGLFQIEELLNPISYGIAAAIPESIQVPSNRQADLIRSWESSYFFKAYRIIRLLFDWAPWVSLVLFALVVLSTRRFVKAMFTFLGLPMVVSGFLASIPGLFLVFNNSSINALIGEQGLIEFAPLFGDIVRQIIFSSGISLLISGLGILFLGLILVGISLVIKE